MAALSYVGSAAAICTTTAFIPQIMKIRKQGGADLSYSMLFLYLTGVLLWFVYGVILQAGAVIWANGITSLLVILALALKMIHSAKVRRAGDNVPRAADQATDQT